MADIDDQFKIWVKQDPSLPGCLSSTGAVLKIGPKVCKTVSLASYGDSATGEISRRELRFASSPRLRGEPGYDFRNPTASWYCEGDEIERLLAFANSDVEHSGRYRVVDTASAAATVLALLQDGDLSSSQLVSILGEHVDPGQLVRDLTTTSAGLTAAEIAVIAKRRRIIAELKALVLDPASTETDVHKIIGSEHWIFGGRYAGVAERRRLTALDDVDIPLVCADRSLHIVELKGPNIKKLTERYRNHWIVGPEVHQAIGQAANYIRALDEQGMALRTELHDELGLDYDFRRVRATVIIGHIEHARGPRGTVAQTIRSHNTTLNRVDVVTYDELLDAAERALAFDERALEGAAH
ncbi:hypothetical protein ABIA33_001447 [Streptacidiphilus sp. MAP12-16]|uniref:Shedu anti-phage system protein SduA domain-containing protein n=1 Tax=Streptacidiphilus sp. MAP12-16 TaxID=3156300 RepID=UPI003516F7A9